MDELKIVELLLGVVLLLQGILVPILRDMARKLANVSERTARIEGKLASGVYCGNYDEHDDED